MQTDVLIIGGGQAGLAAAYYLAQRDIPYIILDKGKEIGEVWKNRYDSLTLFTPRNYSQLPGHFLIGNPNEYPTKDEIALALKQYAEKHQFHIRLNTEVLSLIRKNDEFQAETNQGLFTSQHVIVATGPFQKPFIPPLSNNLDKSIKQLHSANYRNLDDLNKGSVLVVGSGNSGAQIAVELAGSHRVILSAGHRITYMPLSILGKSIFWCFDKLGILNAPSDTRLGQIIRKRPDPVFGLELKQMVKSEQIISKPKAEKVENHTVYFTDGTSVEVENVIWATGFRFDYGWLHIPNALDEHGKPIQQKGISPVNGLYYIGLPWQTSRNSALIGGVGIDAAQVVKKIYSHYNLTTI
ncbi:flavin-containing monooxygenase [Cohnella thermotolerans]|uniref:flavin-containing monooxygenase n=2 Tax=Cohnella TaxID=329857 RepID=UPI0003FC79BF|nr:NAD(P)/FAD-dependent oxidoreductase [Cohnella thermotolerans]